MNILFAAKYLPVIALLLLFVENSECLEEGEFTDTNCSSPAMYGTTCKCIQYRPGYKQLYCVNVTCNVEFRGYLRHVRGHNVRKLVVKNADLFYMPDLVFQGTDFVWVEISDSLLEERLFHSVPEDNKLFHIMLSDVRIGDGKWNWHMLSPFKLTTLRLRRMPLGGGALHNFDLFEKSLKHIVLHDCDVGTLRDDQFRKHGALEMVDISHDTLTELKRSMFPAPSKIQIMIFRNNHLASLPENLFAGMRNLLVIDLQQNHLTILSEKTFKPIRTPVILLQGNPLKCECSMKWVLETKRMKGECSEPDYLKGKELQNITRFSHC